MIAWLLRLDTTVSGLTLLGMWLLSVDSAAGWLVLLGNQALWITLSIRRKLWGLLPLTLALTAVYLHRIIRWL